MAISFTSVIPKHSRRLRLVFSNTLSASAFTSTSYYSITALDDYATDVTIREALVVAESSNIVELALAQPLLPNGYYRVTANGVPAIDASVTPTPSTEDFRFGETQEQTNVEPLNNDLDVLLYGWDLLFSGGDFVESADGDLATVSGQANAKAALSRRLLSEGLLWDPTYGAKPREYVDSVNLNGTTLKGILERQVMLDNRFTKAKADLEFDDIDQSNVYFNVSAELVGLGVDKTVQVKVTF